MNNCNVLCIISFNFSFNDFNTNIIYIKKITNKIRKSDYNKVHSFQSNSHNMVLESLNNIRIIKSFSTEKKELQRYEKRLDEI